MATAALLEPIKGPYIVGFNGPPRSGKDTIATALINLLDSGGICNVPVHRQALAATMRDGAQAILGLAGGDKWYSDIKDKPLDLLGGDTFRRFMINMSEEFVKRCYGGDFWGRLMHARNRGWWSNIPSILVITDIGFRDEGEYLTEHSEYFLNIRLDRPGCDFSNDSRGYITVEDRGVTNASNYVVTNDDTPEVAAEDILKQMYRHGFPVL